MQERLNRKYQISAIPLKCALKYSIFALDAPAEALVNLLFKISGYWSNERHMECVD